MYLVGGNGESDSGQWHLVFKKPTSHVQYLGIERAEHHYGGLPHHAHLLYQLLNWYFIGIGVAAHYLLVMSDGDCAFLARKDYRSEAPNSFPVNEVLQYRIDRPLPFGVGLQSNAVELCDIKIINGL